MERAAALDMAREKGLDLIEIAPNAKPPVARMMSFDKYRYERDKAAKKERQGQKSSSLKQVQISVRMAENDLNVKLKRTIEFLEGGHPVEIRMRLRGREKANRDFAKGKLQAYLALILLPYKFISDIKANGNGFSTTIVGTAPKKTEAENNNATNEMNESR